MYLFADGPREYDFLLKVLSLGRDSYWRRSIIEKADVGPEKLALDIACGTGLVSFQLAASGASVVGVDVTREMLVRAAELAKNYRVRDSKYPRKEQRTLDVDFIQARAEDLPLRENAFDCATISLAMRNVSSAPRTVSEMRRCTRGGGVVMSMDFTRPSGRIFRHFYSFYIFRVMPALGLVISRHWNGIFVYLANSIKRSRTPEQISSIMETVGLKQISVKRMTHGVTALVAGTKE